MEERSIFNTKRAGQFMQLLYADEIVQQGENLRRYARIGPDNCISNEAHGLEELGAEHFALDRSSLSGNSAPPAATPVVPSAAAAAALADATGTPVVRAPELPLLHAPPKPAPRSGESSLHRRLPAEAGDSRVGAPPVQLSTTGSQVRVSAAAMPLRPTPARDASGLRGAPQGRSPANTGGPQGAAAQPSGRRAVPRAEPEVGPPSHAGLVVRRLGVVAVVISLVLSL